MKLSLSEHWGKEGYTVVARAPRLGLPELANGSWHVVGGSDPRRPGQVHESGVDLSPIILSQGGDVVLYRLAPDGIWNARPVLSRGGMGVRPPNLAVARPFDPDLVRRLSDLQAELAKASQPPATPKARPRFDTRAAACAGAGCALLLGAAAYALVPRPSPAVPGRWVPDMNNPRDVAITKGATVMAMARLDDPDTIDLFRIYPGVPGKGARERVGTFRRHNLERWKGELPDSRIPWLHDF